MAHHYKYERLSAQDNDFLLWEKESLPMHGGSTQIFDLGPLETEQGGVDIDAIKRGIEGVLHKIPRYRQKIAWIPDTERAIWIDDPHFKLDYHIRHTALPRPGGDAQLKALTARITERPLDRTRPLWEMWVVEGLEGGRFATIGKTHHCMVDGAGGMDLAQNLFSLEATASPPAAHRFIPRPPPTEAELRRDEWGRLARLPLRAVNELRDFLRHAEDAGEEILERARALGSMAMFKVVPSSDTPLNGPVGPHRRFDWMSVGLDEIKAIRRALDCSVNDVVLAIVAGAVREFLIHRQVRPEGLEFRVATPVNVRPKEREGSGGNHVSTWILGLPLYEADPLQRVARIHEKTQELKASRQASAIALVEKLHEWFPIDLQALSSGTQNLYVTNVPGPSFPLYLLGAEMREVYLHAPLIENLGLTVGVVSYNGRVFWGLNADYDRVPDLDRFARMLRESLERLAEAADVRIEGTAPVDLRSAASTPGAGTP